MDSVRSMLWIVWGAMFASLAAYAVLPLLLPGSGEADPILPLVTALLGALAAANALASVVLRALALVRPLRCRRLELGTPEGVQRFFTISLLNWALSESVALFGVVLFVFSRDPGLLHPFLAGAALLMLWHAPHLGAFAPRPSSEEPARRGTPVG